MRAKDTVSHFWVAAQPFFATTLLVAPANVTTANATAADVPSTQADTVSEWCSDSTKDSTSGNSTVELTDEESDECVIYDVDGVKANTVSVQFPCATVGVVQLEPFLAGLKLESGLQHGHVEVTSRAGTRHICRITSANGAMILGEPVMLRSRDNCFLPITLSTHREQMLVLVNAGTEVAQLTCRLFYGSRSPEWNIVIPPHGSKIISLHDDLLATQDDRSWEKGPTQSYVRVTSRYQGPVSCFAIERVPGETLSQDNYRTLSLS